MLNPAIDRRVINPEAPFGHHLFHVTIANPVTAVPTHSPKHDSTPEITAFEVAYAPLYLRTDAQSACREKVCNRAAKTFRAFRQKGAPYVRGELTRFLATQLRGGDEKLTAQMEKQTRTDTREVWTPTAALFFGWVRGPYMSDLWRDLLNLDADHPTATSFDKLKKAEKAAKLGSCCRGEMAPGGAIPIRELMARGHRNDQHILIRAHLAVILNHGIG